MQPIQYRKPTANVTNGLLMPRLISLEKTTSSTPNIRKIRKWRFPKLGVSLTILFSGILPYKFVFWGTSMAMETPKWSPRIPLPVPIIRINPFSAGGLWSSRSRPAAQRLRGKAGTRKRRGGHFHMVTQWLMMVISGHIMMINEGWWFMVDDGNLR